VAGYGTGAAVTVTVTGVSTVAPLRSVARIVMVVVPAARPWNVTRLSVTVAVATVAFVFPWTE
jgi:hypothetical protein